MKKRKGPSKRGMKEEEVKNGVDKNEVCLNRPQWSQHFRNTIRLSESKGGICGCCTDQWEWEKEMVPCPTPVIFALKGSQGAHSSAEPPRCVTVRRQWSTKPPSLGGLRNANLKLMRSPVQQNFPAQNLKISIHGPCSRSALELHQRSATVFFGRGQNNDTFSRLRVSFPTIPLLQLCLSVYDQGESFRFTAHWNKRF